MQVVFESRLWQRNLYDAIDGLEEAERQRVAVKLPENTIQVDTRKGGRFTETPGWQLPQSALGESFVLFSFFSFLETGRHSHSDFGMQTPLTRIGQHSF